MLVVLSNRLVKLVVLLKLKLVVYEGCWAAVLLGRGGTVDSPSLTVPHTGVTSSSGSVVVTLG